MEKAAGQRPERAPAAHVDPVVDDGSSSVLAAGGTRSPSWWNRWRGPSLWAATVLVTTGVVVGGNQSIPSNTTTAAEDLRTSPPPAPVASDPPATGPVIPYDLSTRCGIDEALIEGVYFAADVPLVGPGDPPPDWAQPVQPGWMTVLGTDRAVFSDDRGHVVHFSARPGATAFEQACD